jgi:putative two-component system response regulator
MTSSDTSSINSPNGTSGVLDAAIGSFPAAGKSFRVEGGARLAEPKGQQATVMIVDDEELNIALLEAYLKEAGYQNCRSTVDSVDALELIRKEPPDVVLTDLMMPKLSGFDVLAAMRSDSHLQRIPVIILTASSDTDNKLHALELGATDFLAKPVDPSELVLRVRNTLTAKAYQDQLANYSARLEHEVRTRTAELEAARLEAIHCLARAAEFRDDDTGRHVVRVGRYAAIIARRLGFDKKRVEIFELAAQLHDVGKIGVPDSILLKPGKLDPEEFALMKKHCDFGKTITQPLSDDEFRELARHTEVGALIIGAPGSPMMRLAAMIAQTHHERWDGTGYPSGLKGEAIPIEGRITAVADVFDALASVRPYKAPFPIEKCFAILREERGRHFDPQVIDAFFQCTAEILRVKDELADPVASS